MNDIHLFLRHAIELEREAARRYEELTEAMKTLGNPEVEAFFRTMAHFSRQHLAEAVARGGFRHLAKLPPVEFQWPDGVSPEQFSWVGVDGFLGVDHALELALDSERSGHAFYASIAAVSTNPRVKAMASEFAAEEAEHVADLEKWIAQSAKS
ncbi:MAG: ferritin family protein [Sulfurimicrobium sp.]|nr:ferritin family protein [Sulfurimicrobium sp.]MDP2961507.1 ferritin family protein [Sulfurimicrobium sp.]MDP3688654.1 ferritin family protein [Sulfurimicrobium sp.]